MHQRRAVVVGAVGNGNCICVDDRAHSAFSRQMENIAPESIAQVHHGSQTETLMKALSFDDPRRKRKMLAAPAIPKFPGDHERVARLGAGAADRSLWMRRS